MIRLGLDDYRPARTSRRSLSWQDFKGLGLLDQPTASGVSVNEKTALGHPAFWDGVGIISSQIGTLPRAVYKRLEGDERERDRTTPGAKVLAQPNENMTDVVFWETFMGHVLTWGNGYAEIEFDRASRPIGLWPIAPDVIEPVMDAGRLRYRYRGNQRLLDPEIVFHVPGLGFDGIKGYSVVHMLRESLSQGMAVKRFGANFFGNGAWPGLVLEHPGELSDEAYNRLIAEHVSGHGAGKSHKTKILEQGMKANKIGIPPEDAQFLQTQEFDVDEVARILHINPVKLKSKTGERPGGNFEAIQIEFLTDTLRPHLVRIEQEANRKLFPPSQRSTYYVEHLVDAMLRVDNTARMAGYKALYEMKVISSKQIARKENLPEPTPDAGPPAPPAPVTPTPAAAAPNDAPMRSALRALVVSVMDKFVRREAEKVRRATNKGAAGIDTWLERFYEDEAPVLRGYLVPAVRLVLAHRGLDADPEEVTGELVRGYVERSKEELLALPARNVEEQAAKLVARWESTRPLDVAERVMEMRIEKRAASSPAPVVHVTVNVPEQAPPTIENHTTVNVPPGETRVDAPVTVNVPPAPPPRAAEVIVNNLPAPAVQVDVNLPAPRPLSVERDAGGNITGLRPKG